MKSYDITVRGFRQERPVVVEDFRREYTITIGNSRQEYDLFVDDLPNDFGLMIRNKLVLSSNSFQPAHHRVLSNTQLENELALYTGDIRANKSIQVGIQDGLALKHSLYLGGSYRISLTENRMTLSSILGIGKDRFVVPETNTLKLFVSVSHKKLQTITPETNGLKLYSDLYMSGDKNLRFDPNMIYLRNNVLDVVVNGSGETPADTYIWEKWDGEPGAISIGDETSVVLATKSTTASGSSTITYANSYSVIDNEIVLDNPSDEVSISAATAGANTANNTFKGKYIRRSYTYINTSASQENTVVDFYYVGTNANATYTATSQYVPSLGGTVSMSGVQLIKTSTFIEYVTSEASDSYPDNGMQDGYWYVKCDDSNVSVTKLSDIDEMG